MKKILALAFSVVAALGVATAGSAEARDRHDDRRDQRYEQRHDQRNDYRGNDYRRDTRLAGSWDRTCRNSYVRRGVLYADCRTKRGNWRQTSLRIENCRSAENDNGRLVCTVRRR